MVEIDPELAEAVILEHYRKPRGVGCCEGGGVVSGDTTNPACGDEVSVTMVVKSGVVECLRFKGQGCAVSQAGASLVISSLGGDSVEKAEIKLVGLIGYLEGDSEEGSGCEHLDQLGLMRGNPARLVCALLTAKLVLEMLGRERGD